MVHKQLLNALAVSVVQKTEILEVVVLQRQLSQSLEVVEIHRSECAVVGKDKFAFGSGWHSQTAAYVRF